MRSAEQIILNSIIILLLAILWFYRFEVAGFLRKTAYINELQSLRFENESLKLKLKTLEEDKSLIPEKTAAELRAAVYSSYPFNDQAKIVINKGSRDGLREGMTVLAAPGILFGKITAVKKDLSEVQTIFDPAWRSSVGIGSAKTRALLVGGNQPALDLIVKDNLPSAGETVINLSPDYPYGLAVGRVGKIKNTQVEPWATASLEVVYNPNALNEVLILIGRYE